MHNRSRRKFGPRLIASLKEPSKSGKDFEKAKVERIQFELARIFAPRMGFKGDIQLASAGHKEGSRTPRGD